MAEQESERSEQVAQDVPAPDGGVREMAAARSDGKSGAGEPVAEDVSQSQGGVRAAARRIGDATPDVRRRLRPVAEWVRRRPALALGVAFFMGFACGRARGRSGRGGE